ALQTSASLGKSTWNHLWAPLGNHLDELFIRDQMVHLIDSRGGGGARSSRRVVSRPSSGR
ncbi:MAG: hypothetical protein ACOC42_03755, partial [Halobacteriota archaeon]